MYVRASLVDFRHQLLLLAGLAVEAPFPTAPEFAHQMLERFEEGHIGGLSRG